MEITEIRKRNYNIFVVKNVSQICNVKACIVQYDEWNYWNDIVSYLDRMHGKM